MGATYTNIQLLDTNNKITPVEFRKNVLNELLNIYDGLGYSRVDNINDAIRSLIVSSSDDKPWVSVYDEEMEMLDVDLINKVAGELSQRLQIPALGIMIYDSDMLYISFYRNGIKEDVIVTREDDLEIDFSNNKPEVWESILNKGYTFDDIRLAWKERGILAESFLIRFAAMTGIHPEDINTGYRYRMEDNLSSEFFLHFARKEKKETVAPGIVNLKWIFIAGGIGTLIYAGMKRTVTVGILNNGKQSIGFEIVIVGKAIDDKMILPEEVRIQYKDSEESDSKTFRTEFIETVSTVGDKLFYASFPDFIIREGMPLPHLLSAKESRQYQTESYNKAMYVELDFIALKTGEGSFDIYIIPLENRQGAAYYQTETFIVKPEFIFRPIEDNDIPLIEKWLNQDYILRWYHEPDEWLREMRERNGEFSFLHHFLVYDEERPFGFCQYYDCYDAREEWYEIPEPGKVYSIDYLIGHKEYLYRGNGKTIVKRLTEEIKAIPGARKIVVQPEEKNIPSVKALLSNGYIYDDAKQYYYLNL